MLLNDVEMLARWGWGAITLRNKRQRKRVLLGLEYELRQIMILMEHFCGSQTIVNKPKAFQNIRRFALFKQSLC